ncbi:MAG TPA: ester cyclase [Ignavibacteriaceae bacterium]|nr:ester cyclase [Ignavibacteriaceae bacterium]
MKQLINSILKASPLFLVMALIILSGCQQPKPDPSVELKPLVNKLIEVWNTGNYEELDAIIDPTYVRTTNRMPEVKGIDGIKKEITNLRTSYPDLKLSIANEIYSENSAAYSWVWEGTNTGPGEMPPTGKSINNLGLTILHFANGKIIRHIVAFNNQAWLEQLGYTMMPPAAGKK